MEVKMDFLYFSGISFRQNLTQIPYKKITTKILQQLKTIAGTTNLHNTHAQRTSYGKNKTEDLVFLLEAVVLPKNTAEVSQIMQLCYQENIPVTPRGLWRNGLLFGTLESNFGFG